MKTEAFVTTSNALEEWRTFNHKTSEKVNRIDSKIIYSMKNLLFTFSLLLLISCSSSTPENTITSLSKKYNYQLFFETIDSTSYKIKINVLDKENKVLQIFENHFKENFHKDIVEENFKGTANYRSYLTKVNDTARVEDNNFGFLVVSDFNLDGYEDFAINTTFSNTGFHYTVFTSDTKGTFKKDIYYSEKIIDLPHEYLKEERTIVTYGVGTFHKDKHYTFDLKEKKWIFLKWGKANHEKY